MRIESRTKITILELRDVLKIDLSNVKNRRSFFEYFEGIRDSKSVGKAFRNMAPRKNPEFPKIPILVTINVNGVVREKFAAFVTKRTQEILGSKTGINAPEEKFTPDVSISDFRSLTKIIAGKARFTKGDAVGAGQGIPGVKPGFFSYSLLIEANPKPRPG
ncbi:TPA: hypothetical protein HA225_03160 [Candidatus Micrarchaeota archaeon]|nr:hypothetical protein [Candidatus Micrarchaeota archaeon]